jgi:enamine deaminase RidA (YjgF/YER057c/UK114 family)
VPADELAEADGRRADLIRDRARRVEVVGAAKGVDVMSPSLTLQHATSDPPSREAATIGRVQRVATDSEWGERISYSRALRRGEVIEVSGTTAAGADAYEQARAALEIIRAAVEALGGGRGDIVRTRIFVVDIADHADAVGRAHREFFADVMPTTGMYGVTGLLEQWMLVEIEATALLYE